MTIEFLRPLQERAHGYSDAELDRLLDSGRERAQAIARATLEDTFLSVTSRLESNE